MVFPPPVELLKQSRRDEIQGNPLTLPRLDHRHAIVHMLDDLEGCVDTGGFGEEFLGGKIGVRAVEERSNVACATSRDNKHGRNEAQAQ